MSMTDGSSTSHKGYKKKKSSPLEKKKFPSSSIIHILKSCKILHVYTLSLQAQMCMQCVVTTTLRWRQWGLWELRVNDKLEKWNSGERGRSEQMHISSKGHHLKFILKVTWSFMASHWFFERHSEHLKTSWQKHKEDWKVQNTGTTKRIHWVNRNIQSPYINRTLLPQHTHKTKTTNKTSLKIKYRLLGH